MTFFDEGRGPMARRWIVTTIALVCTATAGYLAGSTSAVFSSGPGERTALRGFSRVVFLSHANNQVKTPVFPGDPAFVMSTTFTVPHDGFFLQYVKEGEHTGTHYSAPCHFHVRGLCADELAPGDFVLPAVVVDVRAKVKHDVDYHVTISDLRAWETAHGRFPEQAAVLLRTGCDRWWGPDIGRDIPTYYNCGSADGRFRQPGFSKAAVRWLIDQHVLGARGALGTDTFGPDPGDDPNFMETFLTLKHHRFTIENLTNLDAMPIRGGWIVIGGPRNRHGSGAPSTVFGLIP
jgi:kynurenine formamidase